MTDLDYSHDSHRTEKRFLLILGSILIALGAIFFVIQSNFARSQRNKPTASPSPSPVLSAYDQPIIRHPQAKALVTSPFAVDGTVPPGWMFEGQIPVSLYTADGKLITRVTAQETVPGGWQTGTPVGFDVEIMFATSAPSGYVLIEKDNPSGLSDNAGQIMIPVRFK